jgi:hypothetical protein
MGGRPLKTYLKMLEGMRKVSASSSSQLRRCHRCRLRYMRFLAFFRFKSQIPHPKWGAPSLSYGRMCDF